MEMHAGEDLDTPPSPNALSVTLENYQEEVSTRVWQATAVSVTKG